MNIKNPFNWTNLGHILKKYNHNMWKAMKKAISLLFITKHFKSSCANHFFLHSPTSLALDVLPVSRMVVSISASAHFLLPSPSSPVPHPLPALALPWEPPARPPNQCVNQCDSIWASPSKCLKGFGPLLHPKAQCPSPPSALSGEVMWGSSSGSLSLAPASHGCSLPRERTQESCMVSLGRSATAEGLGKSRDASRSCGPTADATLTPRPAGTTWPKQCKVTMSAVSLMGVDQTAWHMFVKDLWIKRCDYVVVWKHEILLFVGNCDVYKNTRTGIRRTWLYKKN